jgi:hypothetical protein
MLKWPHTIIVNAKSFVDGTYHGFDINHPQSYLDKFCYQFNLKFFRDQLFPRLLCAVANFIIFGYADLTR